MELSQVILQRRAVRDFRPVSVPPAVVEKVIEAATWAPSAMNRQPWLFTVVEDQVLLNEISRKSKEHILKSAQAGRIGALRKALQDEQFEIFYHAPVLIVISAVGDADWAAEDCALAAQNLMLAAAEAGLGTCWIGFAEHWLQTDEGKRTLRLPADCKPVAPIILGYPKQIPPSVARKAPNITWLSPTRT
jgi:nitroreductase